MQKIRQSTASMFAKRNVMKTAGNNVIKSGGHLKASPPANCSSSSSVITVHLSTKSGDKSAEQKTADSAAAIDAAAEALRNSRALAEKVKDTLKIKRVRGGSPSPRHRLTRARARARRRPAAKAKQRDPLHFRAMHPKQG